MTHSQNPAITIFSMPIKNPTLSGKHLGPYPRCNKSDLQDLLHDTLWENV